MPISRLNIPGRALEVIGGTLILLVLAGIVSSPLLVKILMTVLPGFRDSVYREASTGSYEMHSLVYLTIFTLIVVVAVYVFLWSARNLLKRTGCRAALNKLFECTSHHTLFNVLALSALFASLVLNMWVTAIDTVTMYSLSSIEILAPEISEHTRLRLRLDFFCMRHADDFGLLHEKLLLLSRAMNVPLSDFDLL